MAAAFDTSDGAVLTLTFDRDVALAGVLDPASVRVDNHPGETWFDGGGGAFLVAPNVVRVEMVVVDVVPAGASVVLSASGATGIVSAVGGVAWGGVTGLLLPYP